MTYRVLQDLVPLVPAFLNLDVLVILALVPRILQASSCLRTFTPALPPDGHILSHLPPSTPIAHAIYYLPLRSQLMLPSWVSSVPHLPTPPLPQAI